MDLFKFEQAVKNGEITDFEHYFENGTFNEIRERKEICIKYGVAQEFYPEWAQSDNPDTYDNWIQLLLASNGYCLDILSKSEDESILETVLRHDLNYALDNDSTIMNQYPHLIHDILITTNNIPQKVLDQYLKIKNPNQNNTPLEFKQKAMQTTPTTIEKTMTPSQLFKTGNPLWALNLTGNQIKIFLNHASGLIKIKKYNDRERT